MWCHVVSEKCTSASQELAAFLVYPHNGHSSTCLWNVSTLLWGNMASHSRRRCLHGHYLENLKSYLHERVHNFCFCDCSKSEWKNLHNAAKGLKYFFVMFILSGIFDFLYCRVMLQIYVLMPNLTLLLCMIHTLNDNIFGLAFCICKNNNNHYGCSVSLNLSQFLHYMMDFLDIWYGKLWNYHFNSTLLWHCPKTHGQIYQFSKWIRRFAY